MDDFWEDAAALASAPVAGVFEVGQAVDLFLDLAAAAVAGMPDADLARAAELFARASFFAAQPAFTRRRLAQLLAARGPEHRDYLLFLGEVLLVDSARTPEPLDMLLAAGGVPAAVNVLWHYRHTEPRVVAVYLELLYRLTTARAWSADDLAAVEDQLIMYLFRTIRDQDQAGRPALRALLALNDQFLLAQAAASAAASAAAAEGDALAEDCPEPRNRVFSVLRARHHEFREVGPYVVWAFNRSDSLMQRVLTAKFCYLVLTCPETADFFYYNDAKVLLDVLIREIDDLPPEEHDLRVMYVRLLRPLIEHTALSTERYKRDELEKVLGYTLDGAPAGDLLATLVQECLDADWFERSPAASPPGPRSPPLLSPKLLSPGGGARSPALRSPSASPNFDRMAHPAHLLPATAALVDRESRAADLHSPFSPVQASGEFSPDLGGDHSAEHSAGFSTEHSDGLASPFTSSDHEDDLVSPFEADPVAASAPAPPGLRISGPHLSPPPRVRGRGRPAPPPPRSVTPPSRLISRPPPPPPRRAPSPFVG